MQSFSSVSIIFIFSWLLMLLTLVVFLIGAPAETYMCKPMTDPDYEAIHEVCTRRKKPTYLG